MQLQFMRRIDHPGNATTFIFSPPSPLSWIAGQSIKIEVPGAYGSLEHRFTISAAPYEKHIAITTRQSQSAYKKSLFSLTPGDHVGALAIEGNFAWRDSPLPKIFIAGGIGITPFYAMLKQRLHEAKPLGATLIYSAKQPIFKTELDALAANDPRFKIRYLTNRQASASDIPTPSLVYISGSSLMVDELRAALAQQGIPPATILCDWFTGAVSSA